MCAEETEGFVGPERKRVTNRMRFFFFFSFVKSKPDSDHGTRGRLRARCPRGLGGGEAALDVKQRWSLWVVLFFSLVVDVAVAAAGPAPACVRAAAWRLQGGTIEQEAGA